MGIKVRLTVAVSSVAVATALTGALGATPAASTSAAPGAVTTTSSPATTTTTPDRYTAGRYIVTFADEPVASYSGYEAGFRGHATQARAASSTPTSTAVQRWQAHLTAKHDRALARVGATKIYDYTVANNGVAVEAERPAGHRAGQGPGRRRPEQGPASAGPTTTDSPHFLGLDAGGGIWSQLGGPANAGAGVVVGVIDSGIWPESTAFAGGTGIPVPADWHGKCVVRRAVRQEPGRATTS